MTKYIIEIDTSLDKQSLQTLLGNLLCVTGMFRDVSKIYGIRLKEIVE